MNIISNKKYIELIKKTKTAFSDCCYYIIVSILKMLRTILDNVLNIIKKNQKIFLFLFWSIILITGFITSRRIFVFAFITIILILYKYIYNYNQKLFKSLVYKKKKDNFLLKMGGYMYTIIYVCVILSIVNNILVIIMRLQYVLYILLQNLNKFIANKKIKFFCLKIITVLYLSILVYPFNIVLSRYYNILENIKQKAYIDVITDRSLSLILSVLIFTDIIKIILEEAGGILNLIIIIYVNLVWIILLNFWLKKEDTVFDFNNYNSMKLLEKRYSTSILIAFIHNVWGDINKQDFINKYKTSISMDWILLFNIESYNKWKITYILNSYSDITDLSIFILAICENDINKNFISKLEYNLREIISYQHYFSSFLINNNIIINGNYVIDSNNKVQTVILNEINIKLIEILLFFIWHLEKKVNQEFNPEAYLKVIKNDFNRTELEVSTIDDNLNYLKLEWYKHPNKFNTWLYKEIYELTLICNFTIVLIENDIIYKLYNKYLVWESQPLQLKNIKTGDFTKIALLDFEYLRYEESPLKNEFIVEQQLVELRDLLIVQWFNEFEKLINKNNFEIELLILTEQKIISLLNFVNEH